MSTRDISEPKEPTSEKRNTEECPECRGPLEPTRGEVCCADCGCIVSEDWLDYRGCRTFAGGGFTNERTGAPLSVARHDHGLSTEIGFGVDANGTPLSSRRRQQFRRLRTHHQRARFRSKGERNLARGFGEIGRLRGSLDLPKSVRDRTCTLFRRAQTENLLVGRSIEAMAAGCVYAACRELGWLRTVDELAAETTCSEATLRHAYHVISVELGVSSPPPRPADYLARIAASIGVGDRVRELAIELVIEAKARGIDNGRNPAGVAAACLYLASQEAGHALTQVELGEAAGVTPTTIRARLQELRGMAD